MLNFFKKSDRVRHDDGGAKANSLEPPANLPDLARDMYEREQLLSTHADSATSTNDSTQKEKEQKNVVLTDSKNIQAKSLPLAEPNKDSVPRLDLSLVKQHIAASQAAIESIQSAQSDMKHLQSSSPINSMEDRYATQKNSQVISKPEIHEDIFNNMVMNNGLIDDSSGFFKEFEEYVRINGLENDVVNDLLGKNWLDHMLFYHTIKNEDMPFYASSAELSHAIKLKLEELQNYERNWIMNKQKIDLLKKLGSTLESDIHLMSEELKKLMIESKKRSSAAKTGDLKSSGFFQLLKPKSQEQTLEIQESNVVQKDVSVIPNVGYSIPSIQQNTSLPAHSLKNYILHDSSKYFYAQNGYVFTSLIDLMDGLESMDVSTFNHHVNGEKNDFSNWVKGVFGDLNLAEAIRLLTTREKLWHYLKINMG